MTTRRVPRTSGPGSAGAARRPGAGARRPGRASASGASARPAPSSRPAPAPRARELTPEQTRAPGSSWLRWVVLGAIALVLVVTLVPTLHSLLEQRAQIAALQAQVAQQQQDVAALQAEADRWKDPAYVEQQARERLKFVKVGDRSYSVIDPAEAARPTVAGAVVAAPKADANVPWFGQLWQSVQLADRPTAGLVPAPSR